MTFCGFLSCSLWSEPQWACYPGKAHGGSPLNLACCQGQGLLGPRSPWKVQGFPVRQGEEAAACPGPWAEALAPGSEVGTLASLAWNWMTYLDPWALRSRAAVLTSLAGGCGQCGEGCAPGPPLRFHTLSPQMAIVFNQEGLSAIQPPCVVQNFINHNAVLYKVFVVGESYTVVERPSLKNFSAGTSGTHPARRHTGAVGLWGKGGGDGLHKLCT